MNNTAYLIFLDGEKHSIWNNKGDAVRQINTLEQHYCKYQRKGASHDKIYRAGHNNSNRATLVVRFQV